MKRRALVSLAILLVVIFVGGCVVSEESPEIMVDGKVLEFSVDPEIVRGNLMVPGLETIQILYGEPIWDEETRTLGIQDSNLLFLVQDGNNVANYNDQAYQLPVTPSMKGSHLMVPLEVIVEVLGHRMDWNKDNAVASIWVSAELAGPGEREALLVGLWSSSDYYGEMYDPGSGAPVGSAYDGEWYLFREDGSFRYVIVGSGFAISGAVVQEGKYKLDGEDLHLYNIKSSWYPDSSHANQRPGYENQAADDERITISFSSATEIKLDDETYYLHGE